MGLNFYDHHDFQEKSWGLLNYETHCNQSTKSGFSFGSAAPAKTESESKPSAEKSEDDKKSEDKKPRKCCQLECPRLWQITMIY